MCVLLDEPNVLVLDEPGNDLDTDMLAVLEDLLDGWPGTLILVAHDRYLMERVTDDQFALIGGNVRHVPGGVDEYLALLESRERDGGSAARGRAGAPHAERSTQVVPAATPKAPTGPSGQALSNKSRREAKKRLDSVERRLARQRELLDDLRQALSSIDPTDFEALLKGQQRVDGAEAKISSLEDEWLELSEQLGTE